MTRIKDSMFVNLRIMNIIFKFYFSQYYCVYECVYMIYVLVSACHGLCVRSKDKFVE